MHDLNEKIVKHILDLILKKVLNLSIISLRIANTCLV